MATRRAALAQLKVHPRDEARNRAAMARAVGQFESVLDRQDPRAVVLARGELLAALDQLEGESFL